MKHLTRVMPRILGLRRVPTRYSFVLASQLTCFNLLLGNSTIVQCLDIVKFNYSHCSMPPRRVAPFFTATSQPCALPCAIKETRSVLNFNTNFPSSLLFCLWLGFQHTTPLIMPSLDTPCLPKSKQDAIRLLHKTVRATRYDDPVDQDAFLVASAHSVLALREHVASFALSPELSECVFTIRTALNHNNARFESTSGEVLAAISDFAGEIVRSRQLIRDRNRAQSTRLRAEEGAAARAERREALQYAKKKRPLSPDEDAISIPSEDEESFMNDHPAPLTVEPSSPVNGIDKTAVPSPVQALLSPLPELESLMFSIRLTSPVLAPPVSPSSPTQSLPDLVPIFPPSNKESVNGRDWPQKMMHVLRLHRGRTNFPNTRHREPTVIPRPVVTAPVPASKTMRGPRRPSLNYIDDSLMLRPRSGGSRQRKNISASNYKRSKKPVRGKPKPLIPKRCFFCSATSHLIAACPAREID
ncbi:hypothetical protein B0H11DRAFT_2197569 [Mycena galericulata]|nr:hypothetical protein B0H11DRAFT_2197569 [Mycena galericulata]